MTLRVFVSHKTVAVFSRAGTTYHSKFDLKNFECFKASLVSILTVALVGSAQGDALVEAHNFV